MIYHMKTLKNLLANNEDFKDETLILLKDKKLQDIL